MSRDLPLHVQMLLALKLKVQSRQRDLEHRTGRGLEDREYQRHVGKIAECAVHVAEIEEMMKADLDEVADFLETEQRDSERKHGSTRSKRAQRP